MNGKGWDGKVREGRSQRGACYLCQAASLPRLTQCLSTPPASVALLTAARLSMGPAVSELRTVISGVPDPAAAPAKLGAKRPTPAGGELPTPKGPN